MQITVGFNSYPNLLVCTTTDGLSSQKLLTDSGFVREGTLTDELPNFEPSSLFRLAQNSFRTSILYLPVNHVANAVLKALCLWFLSLSGSEFVSQREKKVFLFVCISADSVNK